MEPNIPLLRKVMEHITAHPEEYDQGHWGRRTACGTTHCVAGWALVFAGHDLLWRQPHYDLGEDAQIATLGRATAHIAARELGLDLRTAEHLFFWGNSLDDVWRIVENISGGEIRRAA